MGLSASEIAEPARVGWRFDNTYARLPAAFAAAMPTRVPATRVVALNHPLADELGLDLHALP